MFSKRIQLSHRIRKCMYNRYSQNPSPSKYTRLIDREPLQKDRYRSNFGYYRKYMSKNTDNFIPSAAPFPRLPSFSIVQELESVTKSELKRYQIELYNKKRQLHNCITEQKVVNPSNSHSLGVVNYRGLFINHNLIDNIIHENRAKIKKSNSRAKVDTIFNTISEPTFYFRVSFLCRKLFDSTPLMFTIIFKRMQLQQKKLMFLTSKYIEIREVFEQLCNYVDCLNIRSHKKLGEWGPEQVLTQTAYEDGGRAPDIEMHIDHDFQSISIYDMNRFVKDPKLEHETFKRRIVWLPYEEKIFYEKFFNYPKEFGKIAKFLPDKTTKDMIEFYYTHRYTAEMKQVITRLKHRGKIINNKVASEGKVKKK